jgi:hypothetical protein
MSWISGNCQGDRNYECYYESINPIGYDNYGFPIYDRWCRDSNTKCFSIDDAGFLIKEVDHTKPSKGGW